MSWIFLLPTDTAFALLQIEEAYDFIIKFLNIDKKFLDFNK
jgi:hypothetical protein